MSLFQQSSLTFASAKTLVAQSANRATTTEMKTRAGAAIQAAMQFLDGTNWQWQRTSSEGLTVSADGEVTLPYDFKDVYTFRYNSNPVATLAGTTVRDYDRWVTTPTTIASAYTLDYAGQNGVLTILDAPATTGTCDLKYYRRIVIPCYVTGTAEILVGDTQVVMSSGSLGGVYVGNTIAASPFSGNVYIKSVDDAYTFTATAAAGSSTTAAVSVTIGADDAFLQIPASFERFVLAYARAEFMMDAGAPESRISYWMNKAMDEFRERLMENNGKPEDIDWCFMRTPPPMGRYNWNRT